MLVFGFDRQRTIVQFQMLCIIISIIGLFLNRDPGYNSGLERHEALTSLG
jgi:hypothetical protein